jgi:hypothetical protein
MAILPGGAHPLHELARSTVGGASIAYAGPTHRGRKMRVIASLDWTDVRPFGMLRGASRTGDRSVPLLWASDTGRSRG